MIPRTSHVPKEASLKIASPPLSKGAIMRTLNHKVMMTVVLSGTVSCYLQDICSCLDVALVYDDVEPIRRGIPDIVSTAQRVSSGPVRMGAMSFKETMNVDCDLTENMGRFKGAFEDGGVATRQLSDDEGDSEPSSEAMSWIVSGTANKMCGPPPPFGIFRPECTKLVFLITSASKPAGACRSPMGPADSFCSPLEAATAAVDSNIIVSVVETDDEEEEERPASSELQIYSTMTGGVFGRISRELSAHKLLSNFLELLCMPPLSSPRFPAPMYDQTSGGYPHVHTSDGRAVDIYLQPGVWTSLAHGPKFAITGRAFARDLLDLTTRWFNGFRVEDITTGNVIFEAVLSHDVSVDRLRKQGTEVQYLNVTLGDIKCTKTNTTYESGSVAATPTKLQSAERNDGRHLVFKDKIHVATSEFEFDIFVAVAEDPADFDAYEAMPEEAHIELKFRHVASPRDLKGPLAEIIYANADHVAHELQFEAFAKKEIANAQFDQV